MQDSGPCDAESSSLEELGSLSTSSPWFLVEKEGMDPYDRSGV